MAATTTDPIRVVRTHKDAVTASLLTGGHVWHARPRSCNILWAFVGVVCAVQKRVSTFLFSLLSATRTPLWFNLDQHLPMLSVQGVAVPQSKAACSLHIVRTAPRSFHAQKPTSSVWSVPIEVVANIFGFASRSSSDPISQSTALSHVCRQWRQISLSTPSLWTSIYLSLPLSKNQLARTCAWMIRSRNQPLDVYMDFRDPSWDWDEASHVFDGKAMEGVMRFLLVPQASRWRSIELLTDTWAPIFTFLSCTVCIESVPFLEKVRLARCNEYFVGRGEAFRPVALATPVAWFRGGTALSRLRHVSLSGVHVDWARSGLEGLRELELRYHARDVLPTLSEFRCVLRANPALERLVLLGWGPQMVHASEPEDEGGDPTIALPQLKELEVGFVDAVHGVEVLSLFAVPQLRALAIEDVGLGIHHDLCARQDWSRVLDLLGEMSGAGRMPLARLDSLALRSVHADGASIRGFLGRLKAVRELCLDRIDEAPLEAICRALAGCEALEVVTLKDVDPAAAALVLSSGAFPPRLRVFLDVEDEEEDREEEAPGGELP